MLSRRQSVRISDGREILLPIIQGRSRPVLYQPIITFTKPIHHIARAEEHNPCPSQRTPSPTKADAQKQFCSDLPRDKSSSNQHVASRDSNWGLRIRQTGTLYPLRGQNRPASQRSTWIPEQIGNKPSNQDQNHTCMCTPFSWSHLDMEFPWGMTPGEVGVKLGGTFRNKEQLLYLAIPWLDEQRILNTDQHVLLTIQS